MLGEEAESPGKGVIVPPDGLEIVDTGCAFPLARNTYAVPPKLFMLRKTPDGDGAVAPFVYTPPWSPMNQLRLSMVVAPRVSLPLMPV